MIESATSSNIEQLHVTLTLKSDGNEKIFFERTLILGLSWRVFPENMRPELAKLVPQQPIDAHGLSDCMPRARLFSLNWNEKIFFERTLFLGLPRGICPEKVSPALAKLVLQAATSVYDDERSLS